MKRILFAFAVVFLAQSLPAQEFKDFGKDRLNSSPRHADWVDLKSGDRTIKAFVVYPESKNKTPAVLVIQEIFGLTDWLRSLCDELAENGVIAIAPDLLSGQKYEDAANKRLIPVYCYTPVFLWLTQTGDKTQVNHNSDEKTAKQNANQGPYTHGDYFSPFGTNLVGKPSPFP